MEFTIVSKIEKPATRHGRTGRTPTYPFAKLEVGSGLKVMFESEDKEEREKIARRIRTAAMSFGKSHKEYVFETFLGLKSNGLAQDQDGDGIWVRRIAERKPRASKAATTTTVVANGADTSATALSA